MCSQGETVLSGAEGTQAEASRSGEGCGGRSEDRLASPHPLPQPPKQGEGQKQATPGIQTTEIHIFRYNLITGFTSFSSAFVRETKMGYSTCFLQSHLGTF